MTAQVPEVLIVDPGATELPQMKLYRIIVGDIDNPKSWTAYKFATTRDPPKAKMFSPLWRNFVSTYRLKADGTLVLERREYPTAKGTPPDELYEPLRGNFWLDLRESFFGEGVRVPFVDGKIQSDQNLWRRRNPQSR
jgi:hypothetical protein